ncbi:MAG: GDSL-type esterase/lipase family protein [Promethearchaeia archaeon]
MTLIFLCLGNSLTAGYPGFSPSEDGISAGSGNVRSQYEFWLKKYCLDYLEKNLGSLDDELIEGLIFINKGVPGELTGQFLSRVDSDLINLEPEPDYSIILGGTNDLGWGISLENILQNVQDLHDISRQQRIPSMGGTIPPILDDISSPDYHSRKMEMNELLTSYYEKNDIPFADLYHGMADEEGNLKEEYAYADGLHFSVEGYKQMGKVIFKDLIKDLLPKEYF